MKLNHLTDKTLLSDMKKLADKERALLSQVLWHLKEIDRRKLYADLKCSSLYDYCVKVLKYSEGQATRRVNACRMLKSMPEITKDIEKGDLNLTQLNQANNFFNEQNITDPEDKKEILDQIKGKTTRETENLLWDMRDVETVRKAYLELNQETIELLKKLRALKAHKFPDMDSMLMEMCDTHLRMWDPTVVLRMTKLKDGQTRYVPVQVKAEVWKRDQGKCTNCGSEFALELDHIKPFAVGGRTVTDNLRLLCRNCNQRKGAEYFKKGRTITRGV